ncbi:MAG: hydantoinase/oxoprolinase family protein [Chloroflexi bacterium]|nr:hydantoinase/oxoprolinase family protein [Chloroflexota bacterium]
MTLSESLLAVDIGGTFTDIVAFDPHSGQIWVEKLLTSYPDPSAAVLDGIQTLLEAQSISPDAIRYVTHGTTLITNTLIERTGAKTALLTTAGFRDALEIGNEGRYDMYDLALVKPAPLAERRLRFEVPERILADGRILQELDSAALDRICDQLNAEAIEALAICFLHAYTNPAHELAAHRLVKARLPGIPVSVSHQVAPGMREYPRASTTVANAYVQPITERYLARVDEGLRRSEVEAPLNIMLSSGGTTTVDAARAFPVRLVESGPAGGALAGVYWGKQLGHSDVLAFDMGGTTAKAVLTRAGELTVSNHSEVAHVHRFKRGSGLPLMVPMIEMIEIGAGGGSIAHLNRLGLPGVGPHSAGSDPGPAAYARGGVEPTVTDADLLLGYLNPEYFAGGSLPLDVDLARCAFEDLAAALEMPVDRLAWGVHQLVNENMAAAARVHAAERGLEVRRYSMVATGGAGPVHACGVAGGLGIRRIIIPPLAGVGSAFGFLTAPIAFDFTRSYVAKLSELDLSELNGILCDLETEGRRIVESAGVPADDISARLSIDMRYVGQGYELRVPFTMGQLDPHHIDSMKDAFEAEYRRFYGQLADGVPIEAVNWRVLITGPAPQVEALALRSAAAISDDPIACRPVRFGADARPRQTPVFRRDQLREGWRADGPVIIEEAASTTVVLPGWTAQTAAGGCLLLLQPPGDSEKSAALTRNNKFSHGMSDAVY